MYKLLKIKEIKEFRFFKDFKWDENQILLISANKEYKPIKVENDSFKIWGEVTGLLEHSV